MKTIIALSILLLNISSFPQEKKDTKTFSIFNLSLLGGINFSTNTNTGSSIIIEGKTNLTSHLNIKLSLGYSTINKNAGYNVKTYNYVHFDTVKQYQTLSYNVDEILYDVLPVSVGLEYFFSNDIFSPYFLLETGYNYYTFHTQISNSKSGYAGTYNTYDELPSEYKNKPPIISEAESFRIALGVGTNYKLSSAINLDIRYVYQYNKSLINNHQFLVGINF